MTLQQAQAVMLRISQKIRMSPQDREDAGKAAQVIRYARRKRNPAAKRMSLEQATAARLLEFADIAESGATEMTGKIRRSGGREGDVTGRFGGMKKSYPELSYISAGPKEIAKAIRRGKGKLFVRIHSAMQSAMDKHGFKSQRKRAPGKPSVSPHEGLKRCRHCKAPHTTSEHRFHGPGSFHKTHLWGFNPPLRVIYRRVLMIQAQKQGPHRCDAECKRCDHCYFHEFRDGAVMYGLPNGDILIRSNR